MAAPVATSLPTAPRPKPGTGGRWTCSAPSGWLASPVCVPGATAIMRFGFRWRIRDPAPSRALYARLLAEDRRPLLIAANHLTMADSALIGWALGSTWDHLVRYRGLPWNVPEQSRVESSWLWRVLAYLMKCVPGPPGRRPAAGGPGARRSAAT